MSAIALVGAQWGDEGKGKTIDILASKADMVVRAQGGSNAGHTVVVGDVTYKLHLIPSGILYPDTVCVIGNGTVISPGVILKEMENLTERGISLANLKIDARAHIILPYHVEIDKLSELKRGKGDIGNTKNGIGPCYMDKAERTGIRMCDFINPEVFREKLKFNLEVKNKIITAVYGGAPLDFDAVYNEYCEYAKQLAYATRRCLFTRRLKRTNTFYSKGLRVRFWTLTWALILTLQVLIPRRAASAWARA